MPADRYAVQVVTGDDAWREWLRAMPRSEGENPHDARVRHIEQLGRTVLHLGDSQFSWMCPHCGGTAAGTLGETPVSGWDSPRWVATGPAERLTLTPSLGCPTWRRGLCDGHWWLRDGQLQLA